MRTVSDIIALQCWRSPLDMALPHPPPPPHHPMAWHAEGRTSRWCLPGRNHPARLCWNLYKTEEMLCSLSSSLNRIRSQESPWRSNKIWLNFSVFFFCYSTNFTWQQRTNCLSNAVSERTSDSGGKTRVIKWEQVSLNIFTPTQGNHCPQKPLWQSIF